MTTTDYLEQLQQDREDLVDNLETMGITGLTGDETFTELVPEVLNISRGADLSDYFATEVVVEKSAAPKIATLLKNVPAFTVPTNCNYLFQYCVNLEEAPNMDTSNVTSMRAIFDECNKLTTVPQYNTSNVTDMRSMFRSCRALKNFPLLDTSSATQMDGMFQNTSANGQSTQSLENILQMCINATSYTGTKTLYALGGYYSNYPAATMQALSNYQDFLDAGWTL